MFEAVRNRMGNGGHIEPGSVLGLTFDLHERKEPDVNEVFLCENKTLMSHETKTSKITLCLVYSSTQLSRFTSEGRDYCENGDD